MNNRFKNKIFNNMGLKVLSIIFAILFWTYVMDQVNPVIDKELKGIKVELLNVENLKENELLIANNKEFFVDVEIEGRREEIITTKKKDISLTADVIGYDESGINIIPINSKSYNNEIAINKLSKDKIKLELEKLIERNKPVKIEVNGKLANNYKKGNLKILSEEIKVKGPETKINAIKYLMGTLKLNGENTSIEKSVAISAVDSDLKPIEGIDIDVKYVMCQLEVLKTKKVPVELEVQDKTDNLHLLKEYSYFPEEIWIEGSPKSVDKINQLKAEKFIITNEMLEFEEKINVLIPKTVKSSNDIEQIKISGYLEKIIDKKYSIKKSEIKLKNYDDDKYTIKFVNPDELITIEIKGEESEFDDFDEENLNLELDLEDKFPGKHQIGVILKTEIPEELEYSISPSNLSLEINEKEGEQE